MPKVATLVFNLDSTDANGTTYDATVTDLGDVTAFFYNFAAQDLDASEDVHRYEYAGCGAIDSGSAFDCYSMGNWEQNGVGSTNNERAAYFLGNTTLRFHRAMDVTVSRITDGIRLTKSAGGSASRTFQLCIHAVSGIKATVGSVTLPNSSTVSLTTNASDGSGNIDCNTAFFFSPCTNLTSSSGNIGLATYGFAQRINDSSFRQWSQNWHQPDNQGTSNNTAYFSSQYALAQAAAGSVNWSSPVTSWTANGSTSSITLTTSGTPNGDIAAYIAFEDTLKAYVDSQSITYGGSSQTLTGNSETGHAAKLFHMGGMSVASVNTIDTGSTSSTCQFYWRANKSSSGTISDCNTYGYSQDNAGTTVTASKNENSSGFKIVEYQGFENTILSGTTSFNDQDIDLSYTTMPFAGSGNYGYFLLSDDWTDDVTMTADAATFTLTGQSADLRVVTKMSAAAGSFSLTGQAAAYGFATVASTGSFALTGVAADFAQTTALNAAAGSFSLTLQMPSIDLTVDATTQNYVVTGVDAILDEGDDSLSAETGSFSVTGRQAFYGVTLGTAAGSFQLSGSFTTLIDSGSIVATPIYYRFLMQEE